jgi:ribosome-associated protein
MRYRVPDNELEFEFTRSSGPGGQNVNRIQSAVQLRFRVQASQVLPPSVKNRLVRLAGNRMTGDGVLVIDARNHRTQARNRAEAVERLQALVDKASIRPKKRRATKPTKASKERRLRSKKARGQIKKLRSDTSGPG